jgi:hypothetical protein
MGIGYDVEGNADGKVSDQINGSNGITGHDRRNTQPHMKSNYPLFTDKF